ncbi:MAG: DUF1330 domain-containing protein [Betaproteobacteria bacterium]|nr:DUF1330 domain-containing protein [Betaproteobacteria bacterium]
MSACVIGHISVRDPALWDEYRAQVPATLAPWGAEILFRGHLDKVLGGNHGQRDTVVIRFPDSAAVDAWFASAPYQALIPLRQRAADVVLLSFRDQA